MCSYGGRTGQGQGCRDGKGNGLLFALGSVSSTSDCLRYVKKRKYNTMIQIHSYLGCVVLRSSLLPQRAVTVRCFFVLNNQLELRSGTLGPIVSTAKLQFVVCERSDLTWAWTCTEALMHTNRLAVQGSTVPTRCSLGISVAAFKPISGSVRSVL